MIFNLTKKPFYKFNGMQRSATHAEVVLHHPCTDVEEFIQWLNKVGEHNVSKVIVDRTDEVFNNDILNAVKCPVVTLDVEIDEKGVAEFVEYNPDKV